MALVYLLVASGRRRAQRRGHAAACTHFPDAYGLHQPVRLRTGQPARGRVCGRDRRRRLDLGRPPRHRRTRREPRAATSSRRRSASRIVLLHRRWSSPTLAGIVADAPGGGLAGRRAGDPFARRRPGDAGPLHRLRLRSCSLERAAIGFAVAVLLRSQLAGVVVGIVLYIGESIVTSILLAISIGSRFGGGLSGTGTLDDAVVPVPAVHASATACCPVHRAAPDDLGSVLLTPVPLATALAVTAAYLVVAVGDRRCSSRSGRRSAA